MYQDDAWSTHYCCIYCIIGNYLDCWQLPIYPDDDEYILFTYCTDYVYISTSVIADIAICDKYIIFCPYTTLEAVCHSFTYVTKLKR